MTAVRTQDIGDGPPLLEVDDLRVEFDTYGGSVKAVRGVSFSKMPAAGQLLPQ